MQWLFWVIYQNYRGLGLAFAVHFLHDLSIKKSHNHLVRTRTLKEIAKLVPDIKVTYRHSMEF